MSHFGMFAFKEKTRGHRQKCCTCHEKRTTRSVLTPPCLASILSKMPHLSHFGMFAFKEKTRGHRQKCCTCHEKSTTRSVLTPPCLATILSKMPRLSRFGMFAFGFDPLPLKEDMTLRVRFRPSGRVRFRPPAPFHL